MDVASLPKYINKGNIASPHLFQPSKLLSPDVNRFFGTGAVDDIFSRLLRKVFPNLPMNPAFVRKWGVQDAYKLTNQFDNGKININFGNLERGRPVVTNTATWGLDDWTKPDAVRNIGEIIEKKTTPLTYSVKDSFDPLMTVSEKAPDFLNIYKKAENEQKKAKKKKSRVENEKSDEKNKKNSLILPAAGAIAGASLPGAALAQYNLHDRKRIEQILKKIPIYTLNKMQKLVRPGDVGATGYIKYKNNYSFADDPGAFLHQWSKNVTGAPTGHGIGIGKYRKMHHSGINHEWHRRGKGGVSDQIANIIDTVNEFEYIPKKDRNASAWRQLVNRTKRAVKAYRIAETKRREILKSLDRYKNKYNPKELVKTLANLKTDLMDYSDKPTYAVLFRPNDINKRNLTQGVNSMARTTALPYATGAAFSTALKRLFLPKFRGTPTVGCRDGMCGDAIGAMHRQTGGGYRGRTMPVDVYLNREYSPLGVAANKRIKKDALRNIMLNSFRDAAKSRNRLGLAAMGLMGGAGAAAGYGVDRGIEKVKNLFNPKTELENQG